MKKWVPAPSDKRFRGRGGWEGVPRGIGALVHWRIGDWGLVDRLLTLRALRHKASAVGLEHAPNMG